MKVPSVICAISGGVDSAVAAFLLKQKGFNLTGVFMRNWDLRDEVGHCSNDEDCHYARKVCNTLGIPFHEVNLVKEYWSHVFMPTIEEYEKGHTPNPDVLCNHYVKFDALFDKCKKLLKNEDFILATGHYAKTSLDSSIFETNTLEKENHLLQSLDPVKDQTFFLSQITQQALRRTYFPLGHYLKTKVKQIAKNTELAFTLERKESMGICFIGKRDFGNFIKDYLPPKPGTFICHETGNVMGKHDSYYTYTVGQRSKLAGLSISYVVLHKDVHSGDVLVVPGLNHPALYSKSIVVNNAHWTCSIPDRLENNRSFTCQFRFMHQAPLINCTIHKLHDVSYLVILNKPLRALTVGQSAVFYSGYECLGGASIASVGPTVHECRSRDQYELASYREDSNLWKRLISDYKEIIDYNADDIVGFKEKSAVS